MKFVPAIIAMTIGEFAASNPASADTQTALMETIEQRIALPPGASPLNQYVRKYAYLKDGTVIGIYVPPSEYYGEPSRAWVNADQLPRIVDGGCSVVTVFFDPSSPRQRDAICNAALRWHPSVK